MRLSNGAACTQRRIVQWAHKSSKLDSQPSQALMSKILILLGQTLSRPCVKSFKRAQFPEVKAALITWMVDQNANEELISGTLLKVYGEKLVAEANKKLGEDQKILLSSLMTGTQDFLLALDSSEDKYTERLEVQTSTLSKKIYHVPFPR